MFAVLNVETGDFYSESPELKNEARRAGMPWDNRSILPRFAHPYARYQDALRRSQKVADQTGCVCAVVDLTKAGA